MKTYEIYCNTKKILADTITPVSIFLKLRDQFPNSILLESSDYQAGNNSYSFICLKPIASFSIEKGKIVEKIFDEPAQISEITRTNQVAESLEAFANKFKLKNNGFALNGLFGYTTYDAIQYFEDIKFKNNENDEYYIPDLRYSFYKYVIAINHFKNELSIIENIIDNEESNIEQIESYLKYKNFATYGFNITGVEATNLSDQEYMDLVSKGKEHCFRGDVIQIVLSRKFSQKYTGDEFNVYRALRSINPSPYLFFFDFGSYKIFGSSPETQLIIKNNKAFINPIAGTYKRTGNDEADKILAENLSNDPKEKAEHVMLVDLARNDLSRNADNVTVEVYGEIQYYSHVLHMVSKVSGELKPATNIIKVMGDSFPAGTLSGAPKYKAMELIDKYENNSRGFYGGCIGFIGLDGSFNHAIMIRSFLSKNNTLYYQAGAGIVSESKEESELNEVNNKLAALKTAIGLAKDIN